tara:strand:- start:433 stop:573 length:141 start_codon:yes stop_codon:yes gene_type:complete
MNIKINESIQYLILEYKRLKKKKASGKISKNENETLLKLSKFIKRK